MIWTEITPNPASLKFVVSNPLIKNGQTANFERVEDTEEAPIAHKLFDFKFVEGVFIGANFITVSKSADFQWEEIIPQVKSFLKGYFASEQPIVSGSLAEAPSMQPSDEDEDETVKLIKEKLETYVRPNVARDGGDIVFEAFEDGILKLRMLGACSGCPASTATLKAGIETLMTRMVPGVVSVEAV